jgi:2-C-methyl-D-erythritol 2,4-cyclodiphosphate synthase
MDPMKDLRIGLGTDSHRIEAGGPLVLGGLKLDYPYHFVGHSDADVLLHAITDAILSAANLPDIGELFPNHLEKNRGRDSADFLKAAMGLFREKGWSLVQLDCAVEMERPKLSPHKGCMVARIAEIVEIEADRIRIKGKTGEGVGEVGRGELAKSICIALAIRAG